MSIIQKSEQKTDVEDIIEAENRQKNTWMDGSYKGIIKSIEWPPFGKAIKYTSYSLLASVMIGSVLYFYSYGINQLIALLT